jgi:hypothetical protein
MLSAPNVTSRDKALEMPSDGKPQTDVNMTFQNFIILFLLFLFFLHNGRFILFVRFDVTSLRSGVTRNEQMHLHRLKIRRCGKRFWPSSETV